MNLPDMDIRKRLSNLDSASLCDASPLVRSLKSELNSLHPHLKLFGRIYPITCSNDYLTVIKGVSEAKPGDVLVIDGQGQMQAVFGELLSAEAKRRGIAGAIVNGAVRDVKGMGKIDFPVYYKYKNPHAGRAEIIELPTEYVSISGITAVSGDWIFGDADGIVVFPTSHSETIISVAEEIRTVEDRVFESVKNGESLTEIIRFEEFRREHEREIRTNLEYHFSTDK